jgi:hypothetical protein
MATLIEKLTLLKNTTINITKVTIEMTTREEIIMSEETQTLST